MSRPNRRSPTKSGKPTLSPSMPPAAPSSPTAMADAISSLCLKAKPDHATEIRRLFAENPSPSFALIDNIGGGLPWPTLRTCLQAESARDILFALLVPTPKQTEALKTSEGWVPEAQGAAGKVAWASS